MIFRSKTREDLGFSKERVSPLLQARMCQHFHIAVLYGEDSSVLEIKQFFFIMFHWTNTDSCFSDPHFHLHDTDR